MPEFTVLKLLDVFRFVFRWIGVDYPVMRRILQVKLTMDDRKPPTFQNSNKPQKEMTNGYLKSLWIYVLFGLVLIPFMGFGENYVFQMSIAFAMIMFLVMSTLIAEFSSVLLDVRDRAILSTKPISERTINAAKIMHVSIYLSYLTVAVAGIPLIVAFINQGLLFGLLTLVLIVLIDLLIVVVTAIFYIAILSFFDGEKLKDMINYVQIFLALGMMIGYQVLIRAFEFTNLSYVVEPAWWHVVLVPMWFAAPYEVLFNDNRNAVMLVQCLLAIVVPFVAIWLYVKLIPTFERNLQKLLSTSKSKVKKQNKVKDLLLSFICRTKEERAFYQFASIMMKQERDFKLKVYPSLGFAVVIPFIFIFNNLSTGDVDFTVSKTYFFVYCSLIMIPTAVVLLAHSAKYKAAWIYQLFPLADYSTMKKGTLKAFLVKLFVPLYAVMSIVFIVLFGVRIVPELIGVLLAALIYALICYLLTGDSLPFTKPSDQISSNQGFMTLLLLIPLAMIAGLHIAVSAYMPYGSWVFVVVMIVVNLICWNVFFKQKHSVNVVMK